MQVLLPWAQERGLGTDLHALCESPHVKEAVFKSMQVRRCAHCHKGQAQERAALTTCPPRLCTQLLL